MATTENLKEAFAGESQANRKYLAFAKKAEQEGFPQIAKLFRAAGGKGMKWGEGSTVREENLPMRRDAEGAGGEHYKTYRIYSRAI